MICKICKQEVDNFYFEWVWDGKGSIPICHSDMLGGKPSKIFYCIVHRGYFFSNIQCLKCREEGKEK